MRRYPKISKAPRTLTPIPNATVSSENRASLNLQNFSDRPPLFGKYFSNNSGPFRQVGALPVRCGAVPARRNHVHVQTNSIYASTDGLGRYLSRCNWATSLTSKVTQPRVSWFGRSSTPCNRGSGPKKLRGYSVFWISESVKLCGFTLCVSLLLRFSMVTSNDTQRVPGSGFIEGFSEFQGSCSAFKVTRTFSPSPTAPGTAAT